MKIEYVEDDRPEITCINCMFRHESRCRLDDHFIHYGDMWAQTCDQFLKESADVRTIKEYIRNTRIYNQAEVHEALKQMLERYSKLYGRG